MRRDEIADPESLTDRIPTDNMKIRTRFLLFFLVVFLLPLLILTYINFNSAETILNTTTTAKLSAIASLQAVHINEAINLYKSRAMTLAIEPARISDLDSYNKTTDSSIQERMNKSLFAALQMFPSMQTVSILNPQGKIVASTDTGLIGKKQILTARSATVNNPVLDVIQNAGAIPNIRIRQLILNTTVPIGTVEIIMKESFLPAITTNHSFIGSTGELLLVARDTNGRMFSLVPRRFEKQAKNESVVSVTKYLPDLNWGVVVKLDSNEVFQSINSLRNSILIFGFIYTIVVTMVVLFFTHSLLVPITNILSVLKEVQKGKLSKRASIFSNDELGELATTFNFVLESLQTSRNELAKRYREQAEIASIVEFSDDAIISNDLHGYIKSWNRGAQRMYGYTDTEMIGSPISRLIPKGGTNEIPQILEHIKKDESVDHIESIRMKKNGALIKVLISASPVKDTYGKVIGAAAIAHDITEKEKLQKAESKLQFLKAVEEANKELEAFSYSVSHDLRAPLRAIDGFSEILVEDYADRLNADGKELVKTIRKSTKQMGDLIEDLLSFSRIGRQEIQTTTVDMNTLVRTVFDEVKTANPGRTIEFSCGELPSVLADATLMHQVWINLLSNAVKFTKNQPVAKISVKSTIDKDKVIYVVKDNGAGFDMKYAGKLFGVFQRLHPIQEFDGTGIGLSIVKRIIEKHGGTIWAKAVVNSGATFSFSLPQTI